MFVKVKIATRFLRTYIWSCFNRNYQYSIITGFCVPNQSIFGPFNAVFFNLFWFTAPFKTEKKIWRHPYLDKMTIWGTLSSKKIKKGSKFNIWRHPWHLFTAPLCAAAPRLGTTALMHVQNSIWDLNLKEQESKILLSPTAMDLKNKL